MSKKQASGVTLRGAITGANRREQMRDADPIAQELRRLQAERKTECDCGSIIEALVPAAAALCSAGYLVSLAQTRDGRSVKLSVRDGNDWLEWYAADADFAEDVSQEILKAFSG